MREEDEPSDTRREFGKLRFSGVIDTIYEVKSILLK